MKLKAIISLVMVCFALAGQAQVQNQAKFWTGAGVDFDITKRFRLEAKYQNRMNFSPFQKANSFGQIGLRFKVKKWFLIKPSYRLIRMPEINADQDRFCLDLTLKGKYSDFRFAYRFRTQYERGINRVERALMFRSKISVGYNLSKKIDPLMSWEMFSPIETGPSYRIKLGVKWKVLPDITILPFYAFEKQMNRKINDNTHILGLTATLSTGIKGKKNKKGEIKE